MLYLERSNPPGYVLGLIYWVGVDSVMCSDWLSMLLNTASWIPVCVLGADPLWLRARITLVFVALSVWVSRTSCPLESLELTHDEWLPV